MSARTITQRSIFIAVTLLYSSGLVLGQISGGLTETTNTRLGGNNYIAGTVYAPSGTPINTRMRIRLVTPIWGDVISTTDDAGRFIFSGVGAGVYTVVIDEKEFEPVRQEVDIVRPRSSPPETYTVTIRLRFSDKARKNEKPSVIDASNAGVPKPAMDLYQKASKLAQANDYNGAIKQLKLAVAAYPNFVNALNQIGVLYLKLNELTMALQALESALKIKPDAYEPLINRAIVLFRLARFKEAETLLRDALKVKEAAVAYYYLGRTLHKTGRSDEAETAYLTCLKISPGEFPEAHRLLAAIYLERGASQRVVDELEAYLRLVPTAADAADLRRVIEQSKRSLGSSQPNPKPDN
jgi:Flp pilus assembly protein TadD